MWERMLVMSRADLLGSSFGLSKAYGSYMLSASVDLGPVGAQDRNEPGRLQASSKIVNSVTTTGSNSLLPVSVPRRTYN